jgi:hypothetical protein
VESGGNLVLETGAVINVADGGTISIVPGTTPGTYDEVHIFRTDSTTPLEGQATYSLLFNNPTRPETARVLVVAGGGGGGSGTNASSDGGAGRFVYHPAFKLGAGESWDTLDIISVKVGAGGLGGNGGVVKGNNGGNSEVVRYAGGPPDYLIIAPGGGGGGDGNNNSQWLGKDGGSGGGSHNSTGLSSAIPGTYPADEGVEDYGTGGGRYVGGGPGGISTGRASDISGVSTTYGGPGGGDGTGGGGACGRLGAKAGNGGSGIVIFRFTYPWPYTP